MRPSASSESACSRAEAARAGPPPAGSAAGGGDDAPIIAARLRAGRPTEVRARGSSMLPTLCPGERIRIEPCPAGALRPGDLVAFTLGEDRIVLHRVLRVDRRRGVVVGKGDNVPAATRVEAARVLGRVVARHSANGLVSLAGGRAGAFAPWLARLSAFHARVHRAIGPWARHHPRTRIGRVSYTTDLLLRVVLTVARKDAPCDGCEPPTALRY